MKLIVGLGNPGHEYDQTRHNMGFMVLDELANRWNFSFNKQKFGGLYSQVVKNNEKIILLKPQKYINLSGEVVKNFISYFKINVKDILVISDDLDLEVGKYKLRYKGGSGGHNGLKNIERHISTKEYKRIKIGISNNKLIDTKDYVLGKFTEVEKNIVKDTINDIIPILDDYLVMSFDNLMNKYNKK